MTLFDFSGVLSQVSMYRVGFLRFEFQKLKHPSIQNNDRSNVTTKSENLIYWWEEEKMGSVTKKKKNCEKVST